MERVGPDKIYCATNGEAPWQKDALLMALTLDGVEIDMPHANPVPYYFF